MRSESGVVIIANSLQLECSATVIRMLENRRDSWHGNPDESKGRFNVSGLIVCSCQLAETPLFFADNLLSFR